MFNTHFLAPTDQKCADSTYQWQFFYYRPPGKCRYNGSLGDPRGEILKNMMTRCIDITLSIIDIRFSVSIGNKSCSYVILPWVAYCENMLTFPLSNYRIDNVDLWLFTLEEWELQIWSWSASVQPEIAPLFTISLQLKKKLFFNKKLFPCDTKKRHMAM